MNLDDFVLIVREVKADFEREEDQGLLQEDLRKAQHALAGKHACERILRSVESRVGFQIMRERGPGRAR